MVNEPVIFADGTALEIAAAAWADSVSACFKYLTTSGSDLDSGSPVTWGLVAGRPSSPPV